MEQNQEKNPRSCDCKLVRNSMTFGMTIPGSVETKIRYACSICPDKEWSGVLFFDVQGESFSKDFRVVIRDIFVMDVGNAFFTEWSADANVAGYMAEHDLLDCQMGIIHSHNTMNAFFSGTDLMTLQQEGTDRNNIVSLIVNNAGSYCAAVTRRVTSRSRVFRDCTYPFFGQGERTYHDSYESEHTDLEYFMFDIHVDRSDSFLDGFADRMSLIMNRQAVHVRKDLPDTGMEEEETLIHEYLPPTVSDKDKVRRNLDKLVEDITLQLVTGNVLAKVQDIDLTEYISTYMDSDYRLRFGNNALESHEFRLWFDTLLSYFLDKLEDSDLITADLPDCLACALQRRFSRFSKPNNWIIIMKSIIKEHIQI